MKKKRMFCFMFQVCDAKFTEISTKYYVRFNRQVSVMQKFVFKKFLTRNIVLIFLLAQKTDIQNKNLIVSHLNINNFPYILHTKYIGSFFLYFSFKIFKKHNFTFFLKRKLMGLPQFFFPTYSTLLQ